uniref:Zinc finger protein 277 n=1 Tax=Cyprinus carpio TaxID=7962 RepID=A0A8C1R8Z1_CYPCA
TQRYLSKQDCILEPLCFPEHLCGSASLASSSDGRPVTCSLCSDSFPASEKDQLLKHMVFVAYMYMLYWKKRFTEQPITDFCSVIKTNSEGPVGKTHCIWPAVTWAKNCIFMQCLYCEKTFRDKTTLKDHMRKKQHRRINARNQEYDRFYVINYLELGKTWEEVQSEDDREIFEDEDDDWSDWQAHPVCAVCLFCEQQAETMEKIYTHMEETHEFDLHKLKTDLSLKFYQQVKLVNYIRRELHQCRCYCCQEKFETKEELVQHLVNTGHVMQLPEISHWDQPQYYFPTYENDALLTALSDSESESEGPNPSSEVPVIAEDISNLKVIKQTSVLNKLLKDRGGSN